MANKVYKVELNEQNLNKLINKYNEISSTLNSSEFKEFLLDKCRVKRDEILEKSDVNNIEYPIWGNGDSANQEKAELYAASHKTSIDGNVITLYNDAFMDNTDLTHFFNEENRDANYDGFSIAELVEFGAGIVGASSSKNTGEEWSYGSAKGWVFKGDSDDDKVFTRGSEGKYIYYTLAKEIEDNIENWVSEYLDKKVGSGL